MAPFFKSSSLLAISRRSLKVKTPPDNLDSSPQTLYSRSLPNIEEFYGISSRFVDEFHPILQRQIVLASVASASLESVPPVPPQANEEPITSPGPYFDDAQSILSIRSNLDEDAVSVSTSEQSDPPKLGEASSLVTPSVSGLFSSSECNSPKLSALRIPLPSSSSLENDSDGDSTPRATSYAGPVPSSDLLSPKCDLVKPDEEPITLNIMLEPSTPQHEIYFYGGDLSKSAAAHDVTFEERKTLVAACDGDSSIMALPSIERLTPRKPAPPLSKTKTMSIASSRQAEHAAFLKQLDDFAVFFGVEKPSKIAYAPPLTYVRPLRPHHFKADHSCGHNNAIENYETSIASYQRLVSLLEEDVTDYKKFNRDLQDAEVRLNHELEDIKADYHIQKLENIKLNKAISEIKYDFIRILQRQDWEMAQMKRFIAAMIDVELHIPVLYNANDLLEKGATADVALITAIKDAAENVGSPWATIIPAVVGTRPDDLYLSAIKRSAKLSDELHEATKKYQYWKMKAQMEPRHAKHITPSSSTLSLFLGAWLSKHSPTKDVCRVDDLLTRLQSGEAHTWDSRQSTNPNPVVPRPLEEPESGRVDHLLDQLKSGKISTRGSQKTIPEPPRVEGVDLEYIDHHLNQILSGEASIWRSRSSTITAPGPPKFEEAYISSPCASVTEKNEAPVEVPVESDQIPSLPEIPLVSATLETQSPVELMITSPAPSEYTFSVGEESVSTIRPYIPGRALFGVDGLAVIPSGFFYKSDYEDRHSPPASPLTEEFTMVENASYIYDSQESLGLEYIDEDLIETVKHEDVPDSRVLYVTSSAPRPTEESTYVSASHESIGLKYMDIDEIPFDGRCNPILRDDVSTVEAPILEHVTQNTEVPGSPRDAGTPEIVHSTSRLSLDSLKRLSASSSRLKKSISSGLKRLISFGSNKPKHTEILMAGNSRLRALHTHHRKLSTSGKENQFSTPVKQRSSIPRGIRRPTVSSALKAIDASQSAVPLSIKTRGKQSTVTFESPRSLIPSPIRTHKKQNTVTLQPCIVSSPPAGKRVPLSNIPLLGGNSQRASTHRKVIDQGRRAVRTLAKFIS